MSANAFAVRQHSSAPKAKRHGFLWGQTKVGLSGLGFITFGHDAVQACQVRAHESTSIVPTFLPGTHQEACFMRLFKILILIFSMFFVTGVVYAAADTAYDLNLNVQTFQLENGMLFLVVERPATPQVAFRLAIRAGSALEETGKTGIAHMLEHMLFKGTKNFGSLNYKQDQKLQTRIEEAYQVVLAENSKRQPNTALISSKVAEMEALRREVQKIYVPQSFSAQLGRNGAVGVNAFTTKDQTQYLASLPSDMVEQWFSIASEQIFEPAWREFYVEKEVIQREWAFRYINDPGGGGLVGPRYDSVFSPSLPQSDHRLEVGYEKILYPGCDCVSQNLLFGFQRCLCSGRRYNP